MLEYENCELFYLLAVASNIFSRGFLSFVDEIMCTTCTHLIKMSKVKKYEKTKNYEN
jgi:hypothetical protein